MKKTTPLSFLMLSLLYGITGWSQDCSQYLFLQQGKTIEKAIYNRKGEPNGKVVYTVSNVSTSGGTTSATLNSQGFDKKDRASAMTAGNVKCTGGVFQVDMKVMLPQGESDRMAGAQVNGNNSVLEYPQTMKAGDTLKGGLLTLTNTFNGGGPLGPGGGTLTMMIYDRKVEGQESVTTPAGTWNCFKISYKVKLNLKSGPLPLPTHNIQETEWYAPGVGIIKTQDDHGSTAITSVK